MQKATGLLAIGLIFATQFGEAKAAAVTTTTLCTAGQHLMVHDAVGRAYQIRDGYWRGGGRMCITNRRGHANFTVTNPPSRDARGRVVAFPNIFRGCLWKFCSPNARIPARVSTLGPLVSTLHTVGGVRGSWNAAYEMWFGKRRMVTGQADGAELMVWINRHGSCCVLQHHARKVRIDGRLFWFTHWRSHNFRWDVSWNYIQFRLVHPRTKVDDLRLAPFIHRSVRSGLIRRRWWLENVGAGFEIWHGGRGLAVKRFAVKT